MRNGIKNASLRFFPERVLGISFFTHLCYEAVVREDDHRLLISVSTDITILKILKL